MLNYFDAFTEIGPRPSKHPAERWSLQHLLDEMRHCAISSALVAHTQCQLYDAHLGNLRLSKELANSSRLRPIWNVLPVDTGEFPSPGELLRLMEQENVRAVSLAPKSNGWDLGDPSTASYFETLAGRSILVYLLRREIDGISTLRQFLERWPDLPLVVPGIGWAEQRFILPLLRRFPNLHITFDHFQIHNGLEDLVDMGLENQLLFGSNAPRMSMGAHRCYVDYADLPDTTRRKIAGGNLRRLLRLKDEMEELSVPEDDALMQAARAGHPLPCTLIDMHMHILDEHLNGGGGSYRMKDGGPEGVLKLLKRLGCTGGGFMSWNGTVSADSQSGNECTRRALDRTPPGFWGLGSFDPSHYSQEELATKIPALYADPRFLGMKPYHVYGIPYDDPLYAAWWRYGNERGLYALLHRVRPDFSEVTRLAERYPRVQWVVAHCGTSFAVADMAIEAVKRFPNIHAEITLTPVGLGVIDHLAAGCGSDRVLYGSDLPMRDPRQQLGWVVYSRLPAEDKARILGGNAHNLICAVRANANATRHD